jgi:acetyltransferase-like isoleucine patch superfamily enzyme
MDSPFLKFDPKLVRGILNAEEPSVATNVSFYGHCFIGAFSYIGKNSSMNRTTIGRYCSIAPEVFSGLYNHRMDGLSSNPFAFGRTRIFAGSSKFEAIFNRQVPPPDVAQARQERIDLAISIGNDVWIGRGVSIRNSIIIGHGAVVGAGAIVTRDVEPYEIVGGVSARRIRMRFPADVVQRLLELEWWNYDLSHPAIRELDISDITKCLDLLEKIIASGEVPKQICKKHSIPHWKTAT